MTEKILLSSPHMSEEGYEMQYVQEAFDKNWIAPMGENVDMFEKELAEKVGVKAAVALNSGTSAIHMALKAIGIQKGDIVFCQTFTFAATVNPVIYEGGIPVFIDSDEKSWNMDPLALEEALKKHPNAKAVLVVHLYGLSADMDRIMKICRKYNVPVIEDAAESLGSFYKGKPTGTIGDYGIYSFNGNKIITTSGGGMLVSNKEEKLEKVRFWSTQARDKALHYQHSEIGYNYRMSNVVAGIGRGQLKVLKRRVEKKEYIFNFYKDNLKSIEGISFFEVNYWDNPNFWLSTILFDNKRTPIKVIETLKEENIESRPLWKPMHLQPVFKKYDYIGNGIAQKLFEKGICLPSDTKMSDHDLERTCTIIKNVMAGEKNVSKIY